MSARIDGSAVDELVKNGLVAHRSVTADVTERHGIPGSTDPARVLLSRVLGGFEHETIASRGLDIGYAAWRGIPLSWQSPVADARPVDQPSGTAWLSRFTGGLLTTCGLFNIGEDDGRHGLHGDVSHRPAARVTSRSRGSMTEVAGAIEAHDVFGPSLSVERTITSDAGPAWARLTITDVIENTGPLPAPVAMLYHLNIGPPLAVPGSTVSVDAEGWSFASPISKISTPSVLPEPCARVVEAVAVYQGIQPDDEGWSHALVSGPRSTIELDIAWKGEGLPHLHQWIYPTAGRWALAVEPSSAPLFGPERESADRGVPVLQPGGIRRHEIMITAREAG